MHVHAINFNLSSLHDHRHPNLRKTVGKKTISNVSALSIILFYNVVHKKLERLWKVSFSMESLEMENSLTSVRYPSSFFMTVKGRHEPVAGCQTELW
jgi:hypothetical protein